MDERMTPDERRVVGKVDLLDYYNQVVVPLSPGFGQQVEGVPLRFTPMIAGHNVGICPFHYDTNPSFMARPHTKRFLCVGCGTGGSVVRIHRRLRREYFGERLSVEQAVGQLDRLFPDKPVEAVKVLEGQA